MYDLLFWSVWFCWLHNMQCWHCDCNTLYSYTIRSANVFHNNCFVKFKIFASTVVFKFQIKAECKGIQQWHLKAFNVSAVVQLAKI